MNYFLSHHCAYAFISIVKDQRQLIYIELDISFKTNAPLHQRYGDIVVLHWVSTYLVNIESQNVSQAQEDLVDIGQTGLMLKGLKQDKE